MKKELVLSVIVLLGIILGNMFVFAHTENPNGSEMNISEYEEAHHGLLRGVYLEFGSASIDMGWIFLGILSFLLVAFIYLMIKYM